MKVTSSKQRSEDSDRILISIIYNDWTNILGLRFATKVAPTPRFAYQNVGGSLLPISRSLNFPLNHRPRIKVHGE